MKCIRNSGRNVFIKFCVFWEVESYNYQLESYLGCIREYVDNAKNDIERAKEAANDAINEANTLN